MPKSRHRSKTDRPSKRTLEIRRRNRNRRQLLGTIVLLLLATGFTLLLSRLSLFHRLESFSLNLEARLRSLPGESEVAMITISDEDYQNVFHGKSPLDPSQLEYVINLIAVGKPKVIGVDIDTSDQQFKNFHLEEWWPPIVWQRELQSDPNLTVAPPLDVVGGKDPKLNENSGLAVLIDEGEDNLTIGYSRMITSSQGLLPSFPWAVVKKFPTKETNRLAPSTDPVEILYTDDPEGTKRFTASVSRIIELYRGEGWRENSPIKNKIVILGGSYLQQDQHNTPLGPMVGAQVMTNVIETELRGGGYKIPATIKVVLLELVNGVIVALLFYLFRPFSAFVLGVLLAVPLGCVFSLLAYGSFLRSYRFAPAILLVFAFQGFEELRGETFKRTTDAIKSSLLKRKDNSKKK
jgi:hypothetical protein